MPNYGQQFGTAATTAGLTALNPIYGGLNFANQLAQGNWGPVQLADPFAAARQRLAEMAKSFTPEQWTQFQAAIPQLPQQLQQFAGTLAKPPSATGIAPNTDFSSLQSQAQQAFDPASVNAIFNSLSGRLGQLGATEAARSRSTAASLFGGRANPSAAILGAGNQAQAPFQAAQGQSEANRAQALQNALQNLLGFNTQLNRYQQQDISDAERLALAREQLAQQGSQFQQQLQQQQAGPLDWITSFLPLLGAKTSDGGSILAKLLKI